VNIQKIAIIGAGNMGHQIAMCAALSGFQVRCTDTNSDILNKAISFADNYLKERINKGKLSQEEANQARENLVFVPTIEEAAADADLVIEAIIEKLDIKRTLFAQLDKICPPHTILATNSSYIVSSKIADATSRPDKVCNMHFFNPALVMKLVEVVKGPHVSDETVESVMDVAKKMSKTPVLLQKEIYGFLVNRFLQATRQEALKLLDMGVASYEDIDTAVMNGLGYPMGPFSLLDLTGIDLAYHVGMEKYAESGDPADRPSPTIVEKFTKGEFGKKVGKGFYDYE
jgi:3-hydroxybutyryl-CoA dehydrogenase